MSDTLILNADANPLSVVPMSVVPWTDAIRLAYQDKVTVVHEYEDWQVRSPSQTWNVPAVVMCTEYIKWNRVVKYNRTNILLRDHFTCQLCGDKPPAHMLTLDHVLPRIHGGKTNWTNIITACKPCNHNKGSNKNIVPKRMPEKPNYYQLMANRMKYPITVRHESWLNYLAWDTELVDMRPPRKPT